MSRGRLVRCSYEARTRGFVNERSEYSGSTFIFRSPKCSRQPTPSSDKSVIRGRGGLFLWEGCSIDNQRVHQCNVGISVLEKIATDLTVWSDWNPPLGGCRPACSLAVGESLSRSANGRFCAQELADECRIARWTPPASNQATRQMELNEITGRNIVESMMARTGGTHIGTPG